MNGKLDGFPHHFQGVAILPFLPSQYHPPHLHNERWPFLGPFPPVRLAPEPQLGDPPNWNPKHPPLHGLSLCGFNGFNFSISSRDPHQGCGLTSGTGKTLENHLCWGQPKFYKLHIRMHRYSKAIFVCIFTLKIFEVSENWPWPKVSRPNRRSAGPSLRDQKLFVPSTNRSIVATDQWIGPADLGYPWPVMMLGNPHVVSLTWVCLKLANGQSNNRENDDQGITPQRKGNWSLSSSHPPILNIANPLKRHVVSCCGQAPCVEPILRFEVDSAGRTASYLVS